MEGNVILSNDFGNLKVRGWCSWIKLKKFFISDLDVRESVFDETGVFSSVKAGDVFSLLLRFDFVLRGSCFFSIFLNWIVWVSFSVSPTSEKLVIKEPSATSL